MRLLHLVNVRWFNATAWYALNLAWIQKLKGHDVIVASIKNSPVIKKARQLKIETLECDFNSNNPIKLYNAIHSYCTTVKKFNPHIVNCHRGEFFFVPAIRRIFNKFPMVIRFRGDIRSPKKGRINKILHKKGSDYIITSGAFIKEDCIKYLNIPLGKITTIYGGVDTSKFKRDICKREQERLRLGYDNNNYVIAIVGRFDPIKGHKFLIEAIKDLYYLHNRKDVRLIIAGIDSVLKKESIEEVVSINRVAGITTFIPFREDIESVYNAADLLVIPSLGSEAICRVAMEAMACETPVIGSNTGVIPEILPENNIFKKSNSKDIVNKIITHSEKVKIFSINELYEKYMYVVENLLN